MPLCVRFVDTHKDIREEFIQFSTLTRVTGEAIAARVCSDLAGLGLDIKNIRGQGYDGASNNMSSSHVGLQALIKEKAPLAIYAHCSGHCLNLVISHSCSLALMHIHYSHSIDMDTVVQLFTELHPRRLQLSSVLFESK